MKEKLMNLLKNRGVLSAIVALVAAVGGYSVDKVSLELPVIKVEITNWPPAEPVEIPESNNPWPDSYEINPPKAGVPVPVPDDLRAGKRVLD